MVDKPNAEIAYLPQAVPPTNHGHTVAAWVTMLGILLGAVIAAIGVLMALPWLFWVGIAVVVLANVVGLVLRNMGFGQAKPGVEPRRQAKGH
jgi:hypothetical protein